MQPGKVGSEDVRAAASEGSCVRLALQVCIARLGSCPFLTGICSFPEQCGRLPGGGGSLLLGPKAQITRERRRQEEGCLGEGRV